LISRLEIFKNLTPITFIPSTLPVALTHDNEIEKFGSIFFVKTRTSLILGYRLIS